MMCLDMKKCSTYLLSTVGWRKLESFLDGVDLPPRRERRNSWPCLTIDYGASLSISEAIIIKTIIIIDALM